MNRSHCFLPIKTAESWTAGSLPWQQQTESQKPENPRPALQRDLQRQEEQ